MQSPMFALIGGYAQYKGTKRKLWTIFGRCILMALGTLQDADIGKKIVDDNFSHSIAVEKDIVLGTTLVNMCAL